MGIATIAHWHSTDNPPPIPEGKYGVNVLVATYDYHYAEMLPDDKKHLAWDVDTMLYTRKDGWQTLLLQANHKGWSYDAPCMMPNAWAPLPSPPIVTE